MLAWKTPFATEALAPFFLPALVTLLCTFVYQRFVLAVGGARKQFKVPMPKVSGNDDFERVLRVQQNTLEQLPPFLTGLWLSALFFSPAIASILGAGWVVLRLLYSSLYTNKSNVLVSTIPAYFIVIALHASYVYVIVVAYFAAK